MWRHTLKIPCKFSSCDTLDDWMALPLHCWAICSALSKLWSSVPSSSSAVFSWKIIRVCGDWLMFPPTSNPFVVSQISLPEFFMWKLPFNGSIVCHCSLVQSGIWRDVLSSSSLPALIARCPACHFVRRTDKKFPSAERGKYGVQ